MSAKSIRFHDLARYKMFASVNMLADAVKVTLGPKDSVPVAGTRRPDSGKPLAED